MYKYQRGIYEVKGGGELKPGRVVSVYYKNAEDAKDAENTFSNHTREFSNKPVKVGQDVELVEVKLINIDQDAVQLLLGMQRTQQAKLAGIAVEAFEKAKS